MKVYIKTYGCTFNQADSDRMALMLKEHSHEIAESEDSADVVVLNTCSVKDATQEKIRFKAGNTRKPLVVAGCLVQATPGVIEKANPTASLVGTFSQESIVEAVESAFAGRKTTALGNNGLSRAITSEGGVFARVQINSGCASACTFCSTKLARGGVRSYRPREVLDAVEKAVARGAKEIQLASQDTGAYGIDCKVTLPELLDRICEISGEFRVRVGMCNPQHFLRLQKALLKSFEQEKIYKFFHIPIQSGSENVLKHMRRGYTAVQARNAIDAIKKAFPNAVLATDVIVGYPTETQKDFGDTLKFLKWAEFDVVNVSKFSPRPKTFAAKLKPLDNKTVKERSARASALARELSLRKNRKFIGKRVKALVTEKSKNGFSARTDDYRPVIFPDAEVGYFAEGIVAGAHTGCLIARQEPAFSESILIERAPRRIR